MRKLCIPRGAFVLRQDRPYIYSGSHGGNWIGQRLTKTVCGKVVGAPNFVTRGPHSRYRNLPTKQHVIVAAGKFLYATPRSGAGMRSRVAKRRQRT